MPDKEEPPAVDLEESMNSTWGGTKVRVECMVEHELYKQLQSIISQERKLADERQFPQLAISPIIEMLLKRGVQSYLEEQRAQKSPTK